MQYFLRLFVSAVFLSLIIVSGATALELKQSVFQREQANLKYGIGGVETDEFGFFGSDSDNTASMSGSLKRKSPAKAFFLSLAVPGLGQLYNGSKIKPIVYLGVEVTSWVLYSGWHGDGDDITAEFEAFHDEHWIRERYEQKYLLWVFGETDDDSISALGITHHLPDEPTQQYYEMTGKYAQFAWGWDDAELNGKTLDDFSPPNNPPPAIVSRETTPNSPHRVKYETLRHDADVKYKRATRMIFVSIANHLFSAFESYVMSRKHNQAIDESMESTFLSRIKVRSSLKSYNAKQDTPFITVTCKF